MYQIFAIPLLLILGLQTFSRVSNYPYLLFGNFILSVLTRFFPNNALFAIGPITLFNSDITIIFLLLSMIGHRQLFTVKKKSINIAIAFSAVAIVLSFIDGGFTYGLNTWLIADIRKFLYHIILIVFASTCDAQINIPKIKKWAKRIAYALVLYIYVGTAVHYLFGIQLGIYADDRPLVSHYAITLVVYILYEVYEQLYNSKKPSISLATIIAIIAVIINRFNTTWVAMFVGIFVLLLFLPQKKRLLNQRNLILLCVVAVFLIVMTTSFGDSNLMSSIFETNEKFQKMGEEDTTFGTRIELWTVMLQSLNKRTIWMGLPMGSGYSYLYRGTLWKFDPHNGYVETIMRTGIIGCIALLGCYLGGFITSIRNKRIIGAAIIAAMMVYFVAYTYEFELSFILGYILAKQMNQENEEVEHV